jgi:hypothetical protein
MAIGTTVPGLRSSRSELISYAERLCLKVQGRFVIYHPHVVKNSAIAIKTPHRSGFGKPKKAVTIAIATPKPTFTKVKLSR